MGVEYDYVNIKTEKFIELGKDFCVTANAWRDIFNDFKDLNECYTIPELVKIITSYLIEHEEFMHKSNSEYVLDWKFWDSYIEECATQIRNFLTSDIPDNFYLVGCDWISSGLSSPIVDSTIEDVIYAIRRNVNNKLWTRYKVKD